MEVKIKGFLINSQLLGQTTVVSSWVWLKNPLCDERSTLWLYKMVFSIAVCMQYTLTSLQTSLLKGERF
ncbi:MAG: hypothetical protein HWQ40_00595 [Nostoc sp. NMS9]|nr:hypothetical protein [Nostoc sp. NMS9]